jgi:hypothetical protein
MFEETRVGRLVHMVEVSPESAFLVIPALYHLEGIEQFSAAVERYLASLRLDSLAWQHEQCEVLITHRGQSYHARLDPDGTSRLAHRQRGSARQAIGTLRTCGRTGLAC